MAKLKDSGARREFDTGAVRDVAEDKGRCDLLPLDVVAFLTDDTIITWINVYVREGEIAALANLVFAFIIKNYGGSLETAILELSKHYADGAKKYSDRNWEKGMPLHCYIDSAVRHYLKFRRGDTDEPHDRAFLWNIFGAWWTHLNKPELIDLPFKEDKNNDN